jgi:hypothetical protein
MPIAVQRDSGMSQSLDYPTVLAVCHEMPAKYLTKKKLAEPPQENNVY